MINLIVLLTFIALAKCEREIFLFDALNNSELKIDDELCNSQIRNYVKALATKEAWAMDSKIILGYWVLLSRATIFQCFSHLQTSSKNFSMEILGTLATLIDA